MPKVSKKGANKEIERLKTRQKIAQDNADLAEEAKICNSIGELYFQNGDYSKALRYHQSELRLSEGVKDQLGAAIAYRRIGECYCELGDYEEAVLHQNKHLKISRQLGNLAEEQRALATLGRTYFVHSESAVGEDSKQILLTNALTEYHGSLDVCDKLASLVADKEVLEMRSRLYLNLGLVYESQGDLENARKYMEKALGIVKELGDSSTVSRCHFVLGSLHLKERHLASAMACFQEALKVAKSVRNNQLQEEALLEISLIYAQQGDFVSAKSILKILTKTPRAQPLEQAECIPKYLRTVRKIINYSEEVEGMGEDKVLEKLNLYDKLGDLCCGVKAFSAAIEFYGLQLSLAEANDLEPMELSPMYVSLARTHTDCRQFSQAIYYYHKELDVWKGNSVEECDTWSSIAKVKVYAGSSSEEVLEAYENAFSFSEKAGSAKRQISLCKGILKYCHSKDDLVSQTNTWEATLSSLLEAHPEFKEENNSSSDEEESQSKEPDTLSSDPPSSLSSESDNDEDTPPDTTQTVAGIAVRKKKPQMRNHKGETSLHVATIRNKETIVKELLKMGSKVNEHDHCGWAPLHEACNHGFRNIAQVLLDHGANVNDPGGEGCLGVTPLIDAVVNSHLDIVSLLIERGADVNIRDEMGQTALSIAEDMFSSDDDVPGDNEQKAIRDLLRTERRRQGGGDYVRSKVKETDQSAGSGRLQSSARGRDRTGANVLDSSDEEDIPRSTSKPKYTPANSGPFKPVTTSSSGPSQFDHTPSMIASSSRSPNSHRKVKVPSLIPENSGETCSSQNGGHPVLDGWLIDDMGKPPPAKKKRRHDNEYMEGSRTKKTSSSKSLVRVESSSGRRSGSQLRLRKSPVSKSTRSHRLQGRCLVREDSGFSDVTVGLKHNDGSVIEIDSDDGLQLDNDDVMLNENFGSTPSTAQAGSSSSMNNGVQQQNPTNRTGHAQSVTSSTAPLRIRVRIETKSYLIPCPRKQEDGTDTTIAWLVKQATDRYYTQTGVRPELTLTLDGAELYQTDAVVHALGENEEVVGMVKQYHLPPLGERYEMACKTRGQECHKKTLTYFKSNTSTPSLDLSDFGLRPVHSRPIFQALQGQHILTSLNLSGNSIGDEGMKQLSSGLAEHTSLHVLDLSCTAITYKGIGHLARNNSVSDGLLAGLRTLSLSYNNLGVASGCGLSRLFRQYKDLQELSLESCRLTCDVFQANSGFEEAIKTLSCLRNLSLAQNSLGVDGVSRLLCSLPSGLVALNLSGACSNGGSIVNAFQECSESFNKVSKALETLNISHCSVTGECLSSLTTLLQGCDSLKYLSLAGNCLDSVAVPPLCRYLSLPSLSTSIKSIDLSGHCRLGTEGVEQLLRACRRRKMCHVVTMKSNKLKLILCGCGLESPLPGSLIAAVKGLVIETNDSLLLKAKQANSKQFVVSLELSGNSVDKTDLLLLTS